MTSTLTRSDLVRAALAYLHAPDRVPVATLREHLDWSDLPRSVQHIQDIPELAGAYPHPFDPASVLQDIARLEAELRATYITEGDDRWPAQLHDLGEHAPLGLWLLGDVSLLARERLVAVTGGRASTLLGEDRARHLAAQLTADGAIVVTGGAYGIDTAATLSAIGSDDSAIVVLPGALNVPYQRPLGDLYSRVAGHGLLVSPYWPGHAPVRGRHLRRHAIIVALTHVTVVVQCSARRGAANIAESALNLGRPLGAMADPRDQANPAANSGSDALLADGRATLIAGVRGVRALLKQRAEG